MMEPLIYALPVIENVVKPGEIIFDTKPAPKLMKYGFNVFTNNLVIPTPTDKTPSNNAYYLESSFLPSFNAEFKQMGEKRLKISKFNQSFTDFWEIIMLFGLLRSNQQIYTNQPDIMKEITTVYKTKYNPKGTYNIIDKTTTTDISLIVIRYSDIELDENTVVSLLVPQLNTFLQMQRENSSMVIQLFSLGTQISAQLIYFLASLYQSAYLVRTRSVSILSDSVYLVLVQKKSGTVKLDVPKHGNNYLVSIGITVPDSITTIIQCLNSAIIPKKITYYYRMKKYLETNIQDTTTNDIVSKQNSNATKWFEIYVDSDQDKLQELVNKSINSTNNKCATQEQFNKLMMQY